MTRRDNLRITLPLHAPLVGANKRRGSHHQWAPVPTFSGTRSKFTQGCGWSLDAENLIVSVKPFVDFRPECLRSRTHHRLCGNYSSAEVPNQSTSHPIRPVGTEL